MSQSPILVERAGGIATVTLNRPEVLNALTVAMWGRLGEVFEELAADDAVRVVVLRGAGTRAFGAGADIAEFPELRATPEQVDRYDRLVGWALGWLRRTPQPVIAAVRGLAVGGGCVLVAACDIRVAADDARFGVPIARLGGMLGIEEARVILRLIGPRATYEMIAGAGLLDAREALERGLVNQVVPADELDDAVQRWAERLAANAPLSLEAAKRTVALLLDGADLDDPRYRELFARVYASADWAEGVRAFLDKRPPDFRGA